MLDRRRRLGGWLLATLGVALLATALAATRSDHSASTEVMLFLSLCVLVALVGGRAPAVTAAVASSAVLNVVFTEPRWTWRVAQPEQALGLVVFLVVAVAVASVVDRSARRAAEARVAAEEAAALGRLAEGVLRGEDTVQAVLEQLEDVLPGRRVVLVERGDPDERALGAVGPDTAAAAERISAGDGLALDVAPAPLAERDRRLLGAFAAQAVAVLERTRLQQRADEARALEQRLAVRTALLAAVSHDLRSPLAAIRTAVEGLQQVDVAWSDADRRELLGVAAESTDRLQRLIDDLLDLSRLRAGVLQPVAAPVELDQVARAASRAAAASTRVRLLVPDDAPRALADAALVERVLANLVENAVRHGGTGPVDLVVTDEDDSGGVVVLVVDHGPGVPAEHLAWVFEPFQRLGDAPGGAGVGLGLAVARGLAEAMGGALTARPTPGGGFTAELRLPRADVPALAVGR